MNRIPDCVWSLLSILSETPESDEAMWLISQIKIISLTV